MVLIVCDIFDGWIEHPINRTSIMVNEIMVSEHIVIIVTGEGCTSEFFIISEQGLFAWVIFLQRGASKAESPPV
jgi:hypothetical protein